MLKKRDVVQNTHELFSKFSNVEPSTGEILLRSDQYLQVGCDLRDLYLLEKTLTSILDLQNCVILFTAEVSITYMNVKAADALIKWANALPEGMYASSTYTK
jgi:tRNA wybutosine-synthesizing protein 4